MDALTLKHVRTDTPGVPDLLLRHHALMRATSPEDSCHVMRPDALDAAGACILAVLQGDAMLGIGALVQLDAQSGELKSMHTVEEARGRGVARAVLRGLLEHARQLGLSKVSLETGSQAAFAAARGLYAAEGFSLCPPFGAYTKDPLSVFMTRTL